MKTEGKMNEKKCFYCGENPGAKPDNKFIWNLPTRLDSVDSERAGKAGGFLDKDTKQLACLSGRQVCFNCREKHYIEKSKTKDNGLYTEFPVYANV
ncbi:MAG TPA: hypothetical protein PKD67_11980 [Ignavibacteriaceae bacterium]|nr:hypothetical protein [Ignavibacteriaceae bacterium]